MESNRFDALTRSLSVTGSRRGAFRTLAAAGLGLGLTKLGLAGVRAKTGKKKKKGLCKTCKKTDQCKGSLVWQSDDCFPSAVKRCCVKDGGRCEDGCDCCGVGAICNGNYCQSA